MNIVRAFLFQHVIDEWRVILVWEKADITDLSQDDDYILIGQVDYDTEKREILRMIKA